MFHMKPPGPAASLALLLVLAIAPPVLAAGCTLLLVEPACLIGCQAVVASPVPASGSAP
jgi:hypothetical protein